MNAVPTRCLSVRQPWAWAICVGAKDIENRTWSTSYRGPIAIHAGASRSPFDLFVEKDSAGQIETERFTFGAIIGVAELTDVVPLSPEVEDSPWASGPFCWRMSNGRLLKQPIVSRGKQTLYHLSPEQQKALKRVRYLDRPLREARARQSLKAIVPEPDFADAYLQRAIRHYDRERFSEALADCETALDRDDGYALAYLLRGWIYTATNHPRLAAADFRQAEQIEPGIVAALNESLG